MNGGKRETGKQLSPPSSSLEMTTELRVYHRRVSRQISDVQKEKMHEAAQQRTLKMSNMEEELQETQHHPTLQQEHHLTDEHKQSCSEEQKKGAKGQRRPLNEHSELNNVGIRDESNTNGEVDRLLVLAQFAELLIDSENNFSSHRNSQRQEDEKHKEQRYGATEVEANAEAGKSILLLQGKSHLSHVRHQARSISTQSVQEVHEGHVLCHMGHQNFEDGRGVTREHAIQVTEAIDCRYGEGKKEFYHSQLVDEMQGDQIHEKMDHICDKAQKGEEQVNILDEQREQQQAHLFVTAPAQQLEVTDERGQQLNVQQPVIGQQHPDLTQQQQRCISMEQMHAQSERSEPQGLMEMSDNHKDRRDIASQQRPLRTYKRRKQLSRKNSSAIMKHGHPMAGEQSSEMYVAEQGLLPPTTLVLGGQQVGVDPQWLLQMPGIQMEQHQITAGQHPVEVQRAIENAHNSLPGCNLSEEGNSDRQSPHLHAATMDEKSDELLVKDQEHQPQLTQVTVEAVKEVLRVQGQISLTHLKVIARSTHASFVEEKQEAQVDCQNGEGNVEEKQDEQVDHQNEEGNVEEEQEEQVDRQNGEGEPA